jgi:hypothetical protein|tara:strand:+ start:5354 stop:5545 length:192 start_codon:yes stop_codon:yes gene_type:complete
LHITKKNIEKAKKECGNMPDIVFMDMDGNEIRKDLTDINSLDDVKKSFKELDKKRKDKKNGQV